MLPAYLVENMMHSQYSLIIQLSKEAARLSYLIFETEISSALLAHRTFLVHSLYDSSEIYFTLGLDCCPGGCQRKRACDKKEAGS